MADQRRCPIEKIQTDMMLDSSPEKLWYYEKYYQKKHQLPHAIVVDENKQLRDGYISYLLAKKYNVRADVCEMISGQPMRKIVKGIHVKFSDGNWRKKGNKRYVWIYTLKEPVIPGDILLVKTKRGTDFICVESINSAIRMFLTQAVANNGLPFEIKWVEHNPYTAMSEEMMLEKLEKSRVSASKGNYRSADEVIADMREKYGI